MTVYQDKSIIKLQNTMMNMPKFEKNGTIGRGISPSTYSAK